MAPSLISMLRDSVAVQQRLETYLARPMFLAVLEDGLLKAERVDEGLAAVDEGFAFAARTGEGGYVAELHRVDRHGWPPFCCIVLRGNNPATVP